jgi:hypothetical protein
VTLFAFGVMAVTNGVFRLQSGPSTCLHILHGVENDCKSSLRLQQFIQKRVRCVRNEIVQRK